MRSNRSLGPRGFIASRAASLWKCVLMGAREPSTTRTRPPLTSSGLANRTGDALSNSVLAQPPAPKLSAAPPKPAEEPAPEA